MSERKTILGVDPGTKRVGVAIADLETRFAQPLEIVEANDAVARIAELARLHGAMKIVVGRPIGLSGRAGPAVQEQQILVEKLRAATPVEVVEHDERLTTVIAESGLRAAGGKARSRRELRDSVAAQVMLQGFLDATR